MPSRTTAVLIGTAWLVGCDGNGGDSANPAAGRAGDEMTIPVAGTSGMAGAGGTSGASGRAGAQGGTAGTAGGGMALGAGTAGTGGAAYSTNFALTESPLSENGVWHHAGLDWTTVDAAQGIAFGTQELDVPRSGPEQYNDSYAYLDGFPTDQQASAVVALGSIDTSCTHEVEILLRWADSPHDARGYECNVAYDGSYAQIVRWNGPVGDYMYLGEGNVPGGMHDGDTVSASVVGDTITLSVNGAVRATARDATFADGNPGIGFWRGSSGCGTLGDYGFESFSAGASVP